MKLRNCGTNQTELKFGPIHDETIVFFSYDTPVVIVRNGQVFRTSQKHSKTTFAHINSYLLGWDTLPVANMEQSYFDSFLANANF